MLRRGLPVEYSYFLISFFFQKVWEPCANSPPPAPSSPPLHLHGPWWSLDKRNDVRFYCELVVNFLQYMVYIFLGKKSCISTCFKSLSQLVSSRERSDDRAVASYWKQQKLMKLIRVVYSEKIDNQKYIILINHRHVNLVNRKLTAELTPESLRRFYRKKAFF